MIARTPYEKGMSACRRGKRMSDNPYHRATERMSVNHRAWLQGFADQARKEADEADERLTAEREGKGER